MQKLARLLRVALIALIGSVQSPAPFAASLYQVEVIVFARPGGGGEEHSASGQGLQYPLRTAALQTAPADAGSVGAFQLLPASARLLNNEEAALGRRGFPILFHGAWRQSVDTVQRATGALVDGGRSAGALRELSGYVALSAENYLHVDVNLWLSQFAAGGDHPGDIQAPPLPPGALAEAGAEPAAISRLSVLHQRRKVRSGELHYFDHPRFGALLLVRPVE